jgi:glycosyltransferase involved in cell wall biosynthesis
MLSMLRGEEGHQARELNDLIAWLKTQPKPDTICLSNALLAGFARQLKAELKTPVVCLLAGEDTFLDGLPPSVRDAAWATLAERSRDVDLFLPPSRYYADLMSGRLALRPQQVQVLPNGISLAGYSDSRYQTPNGHGSPVLGYFARMCREKGLDTLVDAFVFLKQRDNTKNLRLHVGGGCGPGDEPFVEQQRRKLAQAGLTSDVQFFPNVDHAQKIAFYEGLTVFSTPALYGEAFGLYLIEALAAGVPVVQPRHAGFPEIIEATGGGVLCEPGSPKALADAIEDIIRDPARARELGVRGQDAVKHSFTIERMGVNFVAALQNLSAKPVATT